MSGHFLTPSANPREIARKAASYTLLFTDYEVEMNGTYTATLPSIATLAANGLGSKTYKIENKGTTTVTISCNSADTIEDGSSSGATSVYLYAQNDYMILEADPNSLQWKTVFPDPHIEGVNVKDDTITGEKLSLSKHYGCAAALTTGTTAVNVFGTGGAPHGMTVTSVIAVAQDTNAGNMVLKNGTNTVASFAKSTTAGVVTGEDGALANTSVTAADTCTVESSSTNGNGMVIIGFTSP
jgi:hypothetical protein